MAASKEVVITGKVRFAFTNRLNQFGKWVIGIYPDAKSLEIVQSLIKEGIKNELKQDDEGYWIAFSRPPDKTDRTGRKFSLTPPVCIDRDGKVFTDSIGAGSDVAVRLETYGGKSPVGSQYKAARFGGVKIYHLVPYNPEDSTDKFESRAATGLNKAPEPTDW